MAIISFKEIFNNEKIEIAILESEKYNEIFLESIKLGSEWWHQMTSTPVAVMEKGFQKSNLFLKFMRKK